MKYAAPLPPCAEIEHAQVLYGWKEIGLYLRRSRPTVQRWHESRRMPIAYLGMTVVIPRSALDLWIMAGRTTRETV